MSKNPIKDQWTERARAVFASFAERAEALAGAARRVSEGTDTAEDRALLGDAWEESGRYSGRTRGLLVEHDTTEHHTHAVVTSYLFPEPEEDEESKQAWLDQLAEQSDTAAYEGGDC